MIPGLGVTEMIFIFAILLLLFGAKRLPELASGMGKGIRDFKRALNGMDENSIQANQSQAPAQMQSQAARPGLEASPAAAEAANTEPTSASRPQS